MLQSTANLLVMIHAFFDEIDYHPTSENLNGDELFDRLVYTLNHTKTFDDGLYLIRLYDYYLKREYKFYKKYSKYPDFWDYLEYNGREKIAVVNDNQAIGTYYITNMFDSDFKSIYFSSQSFEGDYYLFEYKNGYFSFGEGSEYYLRYSKLSNEKMVLTDSNKKNIAIIVLSKDLGIFLENNNTRYELEIYDIGIAFFEKDYIYSLSNKEEPDLDKECKGFIQWDSIDKKGEYGLSRLEVYDENADLDLMLILSAAVFLVFRSHIKSYKSNALFYSMLAANAVRRR